MMTINLTTRGRAGGRARAAKLSPAKRKAVARKAVAQRWANYYAQHPEKKAAKLARDRKKVVKAAAKLGELGGRARVKATTKKQRHDIALAAITERWRRARARAANRPKGAA